MMLKEVWRDIEGYNGKYQVSSHGNIKSLKWLNGLMKLTQDKDGYLLVKLRHNAKQTTFKVHRLVAKYFIDNPFDYAEVNHEDGNKKNNNVLNLTWASGSMNRLHAYKTGLRKSIKDTATKASRSVMQIDADGNMINKYPSISAAARHTGEDGATIIYQATRAKVNQRWRYAI